MDSDDGATTASVNNKMFRATKRYIWRNKDRLGFGTFGQVFLGYAKESAQPVAIKVSEADNRAHVSPEYRAQHERECRILTQLQHANIVRALAVESELSSVGPLVLVMEYVNGGSVHSMLQSAEWSYGLDDELMLPLLRDLGSALQYLRSVSFVLHRDIKPSNILRHCDPDTGESQFKLCDFGAARVLSDSQPFQSLVGTPEYLHPALISRAAGCASSVTSSSTDLWSIGVTVYHCATGRLPFAPAIAPSAHQRFGAWMEFCAQRPPLAISGQQRKASGPIEWSDAFPVHCNVSRHLRGLLEQLIRSLLACCSDSAEAAAAAAGIQTNDGKQADVSRQLQDNAGRWSQLFSQIEHIVSALRQRCAVIRTSNGVGRYSACLEAHAAYASRPTSTVCACGDGTESDRQCSVIAIPCETSSTDGLTAICLLDADIPDVQPLPLPYTPRWSAYCAVDEDYATLRKCVGAVGWLRNEHSQQVSAQLQLGQAVRTLRGRLQQQLETAEQTFQATDQCQRLLLDHIRVLHAATKPVEPAHPLPSASAAASRGQLDAKTRSSTLISEELLKLNGQLIHIRHLMDQILEAADSLTDGQGEQLQADAFASEQSGLTDILQQYNADRLDALSLTRDANSTKFHNMLKKGAQSLWERAVTKRDQFKSHQQHFAGTVQNFLAGYRELSARLDIVTATANEHQAMIGALSESMHKINFSFAPPPPVDNQELGSIGSSCQSFASAASAKQSSLAMKSLAPQVADLMSIMKKNVTLLEQLQP